jgi:hypothetical protein
MPTKRKLTMRELRQMLRLAYGGVSAREIGRVLGIARSTVQENLGRAAQAGLTWPLPAELTDDALAGRLFARSGAKTGQRRQVDGEGHARLIVGNPRGSGSFALDRRQAKQDRGQMERGRGAGRPRSPASPGRCGC